MKHNCPICGHDYELGPGTLPECPECIRLRFQHPGGIKWKHTPSGAASSETFASFVADGMDGEKMYDYLAYGPHTQPTGCEVFYSHKFNSFNAVTFEPLNQIPGSGNATGIPFASNYAVLQDIQGNSEDGPHWAFEDPSHLQHRIMSGKYSRAPKCSQCDTVVVYNAGDVCLNCQRSGI